MTAQLFDYKGKTPIAPRCHTTHPTLKLGKGELLGASCGSPRDGFDVYIGFCYTMKLQHQPYPWELKTDPVIEFPFEIIDMKAPSNPAQFAKLVDWVVGMLDAGKRIHVGCIGGHGRTGTFLAALVSKYPGITDDPIAWVRKNHCVKAVESKVQIDFLIKHFGCKTAKPTKAPWYATPRHKSKKAGKQRLHTPSLPLATQISHVPNKGSIWR